MNLYDEISQFRDLINIVQQENFIKMSGRKKALNTAVKTLKYFTNPLIQGKYPVIPPLEVPKHIVPPPYVNNPNPKFGLYEGTPIVYKNQQIQKLRKAAKVASNTLAATQKFILQKYKNKQQLTQQDIDRFVFNHIINQGAYPTPIGFMNFPKSVCISVNQCIVHGIPSTRVLEEGDKINIDVTVYIDGYHGDNNLTVFYGPSKHQNISKIVQLAQKALYEAISICKPGVPFNQIGYHLQNFAAMHNIHVCDQFSGHGVGKLLHMPPMVLHKYYPQLKDVMKVGNIFTIEPIFTWNEITNLQHWKDGFTTISPDNPNAQFQHTILIVEDGCQILTLRDDEIVPNAKNTIKNLK